jgi:hypothetical protein
MLPEPETLPEPEVLPEPESDPLDVELESPVIDPDDELEPVPVELDDEPEGVREPDIVVPLSVALPEALPEPESILPVAAPPRGPLSFTCAWQPANARAPATIGIAHNLFFIRHLLPSIVADPKKPTIREKTLRT